MADTILVVVEQREGKLNRVSYETLTGAQAIAAENGWTLEAAVLGSGPAVAEIAAEIAKAKVAKVYALESVACANYTPDAYAAALKQFIGGKKTMISPVSHTYQEPDVPPQPSPPLLSTPVSDVTGDP